MESQMVCTTDDQFTVILSFSNFLGDNFPGKKNAGIFGLMNSKKCK